MTKKDHWALSDRQWFLMLQPEANKSQLLRFIEQVKIKKDSGIPENKARWETFLGE